MGFSALRKNTNKKNLDNNKTESPVQVLRDVDLLIKKGEFQEALNLCDSIFDSKDEPTKVLETKALLNNKLGKFENSLENLAEASKYSHPKLWRWRLAHQPIRELKLSQNEIKVFWNSCMGPLDREFANVREAVIQKNLEAAMESIERLSLQGLSVSASKSLYSLVRNLSESPNTETKPKNDTYVVCTPRIALVSGTGWSGSGAIFDYLTEFPEVTAVKYEPPFFGRGPASIFEIKKALRDKEASRRKMVDFVFHYLIGFGEISTNWDMKILEAGRKLWDLDNQESHFSKIQGLVEQHQLIWGNESLELKEQLIHNLSNRVLQEFVIGRELIESELIVLDNSIPAANIEASMVFPNTVSICCVRDPRSNYAALRAEDVTFGANAKTWSSNQKKVLAKVFDQVKELNESKDNVTAKVIQFEDFILNESRRQSVAQLLNLHHDQRVEYSRFKPWESAKNVVLHEFHKPSSDITIIASELPEYCMDLGVKGSLLSRLKQPVSAHRTTTPMP